MINFKYYPDDNFTLAVLYGDVTPQELHDLVDEVLMIEKDEGGMLGMSVLCSNAKPKGIKASDIINVGKRMQQATFRKNGKNAIVAKTAVAYGLARVYKVATDIVLLDELRIYKKHQLDNAIEWLDLYKIRQRIINIVNQCELAV